jgi:hypothetical protein
MAPYHLILGPAEKAPELQEALLSARRQVSQVFYRI